jgi:transposase-like protein
VTVARRWCYGCRAVDQFGPVIDVDVSSGRDTQPARRCFATAIRAHGEPAEVVADRAGTLLAVIDALVAGTFHHTDQDANHRSVAAAFTDLAQVI